MRMHADKSTDSPVIIPLTDHKITFTATGRTRMEQILNDTGAAIVYSDFYTPVENSGNFNTNRLINYQEGSLRDDFDFGHIAVVNPAMLRKAVAEITDKFNAAGWYDLRLRLSRLGKIIHIPETLYTASPLANSDEISGEEAHFSYVDPRNRASQIEMEQAVTSHLREINALVNPECHVTLDFETDNFPVEASVIIPVRNRHLTIADAVKSALSQKTSFSFNVIVIDNRSTDGTSEI
ncbi:MAG: glycosyltransferase, partial [Duncaniella sp.]|nr:glycosyltransferase [Duncaniella sp.]